MTSAPPRPVALVRLRLLARRRPPRRSRPRRGSSRPPCSVSASSIVSTCASASRDFIACVPYLWPRGGPHSPHPRRGAADQVGAAGRASDRGRHRPARRAQLRPRRGRRRSSTSPRSPELKGWSRENGSLRLGAGLTYTEAMQPRARRAAARARRGVAHRRLAADPQPRHDRRQPRHRLAGRRRASAAARRGRDRRDRQRARRPHAAADRVLPRPEAERARRRTSSCSPSGSSRAGSRRRS